MSQPEVVVSAAHVRKSFGDKEVLRDISFEVGSGEVTVVLGPSGSGLSLIHISEPTRPCGTSRMPSSA